MRHDPRPKYSTSHLGHEFWGHLVSHDCMWEAIGKSGDIFKYEAKYILDVLQVHRPRQASLISSRKPVTGENKDLENELDVSARFMTWQTREPNLNKLALRRTFLWTQETLVNLSSHGFAELFVNQIHELFVNFLVNFLWTQNTGITTQKQVTFVENGQTEPLASIAWRQHLTDTCAPSPFIICLLLLTFIDVGFTRLLWKKSVKIPTKTIEVTNISPRGLAWAFQYGLFEL